jgi:hypothetical protein
MMDSGLLRIIYTFFLGLLLAVFIGVGINTFYEPPTAPRYSPEMNSYGKELTDEQAAKQREFDIANEKYFDEMKPYNRNVSIISLAAAVFLLVLSIIFQSRIKLISGGVMLGGLFTLLYSIIRGFASEDSKYLFVVITVGLLIVLVLGYRRFVRNQPHDTIETGM